MAEAGRPSELTDDLFVKIKQAILDGSNLRELANVCEVSEDAIYKWSSDNYRNFSDKVEGWKRDRLIRLASNNVNDILLKGANDKDTLKVVADISKFVLEALDKPYKPKKDLTTNDKEIIPIYGGQSTIQGHNSDQENL